MSTSSSKDKKTQRGAQADLPHRHNPQLQRGGRAETQKPIQSDEREGPEHGGRMSRSRSMGRPKPNGKKGSIPSPYDASERKQNQTRDLPKDDPRHNPHNGNLRNFHRQRSPVFKDRARSASVDSRSKVPVIEFQEGRNRWMIANQSKRPWVAADRLELTIHVFDPTQMVFIVNCRDVTLHIHGTTMSGLVIDSCNSVNVVFDSILSACEVFDSKQLIIETKGVCPTFQLDGTQGCTVWLSRDSMKTSSFVTSKCTALRVSIPHGDDEYDRVEVPIPEQFVHKIFGESIESSASYIKLNES
jgi:Adenylate cyclase associated (CAP) C terminal